jgi:hypothetical protein
VVAALIALVVLPRPAAPRTTLVEEISEAESPALERA